jgi:hypothetical protein
MTRLLFLGPAVIAMSGCTGTGTQDIDDFESRPLPYSVAVYFDTQASKLPDPLPNENTIGPPRFQWTPEEVALSVARALADEHRLVSSARIVRAGSRREALEDAKNDELLIAVAVEAPEDFGDPERSWGWGTLEVGSWLFGGLGSWFVPTLSYGTKTRLTLRAVDVNEYAMSEQSEEGNRPETVSVELERNSLSLWERDDISEEPGQYALTIVAPPMALRPGSTVAEGTAVTKATMSELETDALELLEESLVLRELAKPFRVGFVSPTPSSRLTAGATTRVVLEIVSKDNVGIDRLDLHRLAESTATYRWVASPERLDEIRRELEASKDGRVRFEIPADLPLVPGRNTIKLRALRTDGVRSTSTVVYVCEESR